MLVGEAERAFYGEVLAQGGKVLFRDVAEQDAATVLRLLELGLLIHHTGDATLTAVNPRTVAEQRATELRRAGTGALRQADEVPDLLGELARAYDAAPRRIESTSTVLHIEDMEQIRSRIVQLDADRRDELLAAHPGGARPMDLVRVGMDRTRRFVEGGGVLHVLYQGAARTDGPTAEYAAMVSEWGARVRVLDEPFSRILIYDRTTAVISASADHTRAAIVEDPAVVSFLVSGFERDWERAERVRWQVVGDRMHEQVGQLLTQGLTQRKIASRLGLSERTVAGHIARLRERYDAETLFQLGWQMRGAEGVSAG
ncbi:DNA-binding transcriptional ArsR family regulator [Kitasatospora gansuensis]|uniref:DNA-binding transcriptional ArsR family regulator n=1 Tax=Kitasatospora gansuensis TaxID=258050 RepID=A0A7W7SC05_9ACTN|nr:LuxR C-terminal-related transcriptional regulator [Kitasatospora gansuensis]MBB4947694.1 DNA-binding transcriptional ArsR family regulator [Kitasatospora gansuensis]